MNFEDFSTRPISRKLRDAIFKAGLTQTRLAKISIRHTFASLLLSIGESPVYVKEQLGHSKISTTVDIYGHLIPSSNRNAINRLDNTQPEKIINPQPFKIAGNA